MRKILGIACLGVCAGLSVLSVPVHHASADTETAASQDAQALAFIRKTITDLRGNSKSSNIGNEGSGKWQKKHGTTSKEQKKIIDDLKQFGKKLEDDAEKKAAQSREKLHFVDDVLLPFADEVERRAVNGIICGNCGDLTAVAFKRLNAYPGLVLNYISLSPDYDHCFLLVKLPGSRENYIADPWYHDGEVIGPVEVKDGKLYMKGSTTPLGPPHAGTVKTKTGWVKSKGS